MQSTISCKVFYGAPPHEILEKDAFEIFDGVNSWIGMIHVIVYLPIFRKVAMKVLPNVGEAVSPFYCLLRKVRWSGLCFKPADIPSEIPILD